MKTARSEMFERAPVGRAVLSQIVPSVASQMIVLLYNLADTYFVGMLNDPVQTAAVTVSFPLFLMLTALSNLFGVGGASAIARALGKKETHTAGQIASVCVWCGFGISVLFSVTVRLLSGPLLTLCGATTDTMVAALDYVQWVVVIGGPFTVLNTLLANLVRSEGGAATASVGVSFGGILNMVLDPFFILPSFLGFRAAGAGMATAIANAAACVYFLLYIIRKRGVTVLSVHPRLLRHTKECLGDIVSVGLPSALQYALTVVAVAAQARFVSGYHITAAVAALGIVKKMDQLPLYVSIGVANGLLPFLAFNHAAGNTERRKSAFRLGVFISLGFALLCFAVYQCFAPTLVRLFIQDETTVRYGAVFLRILVTAVPLMSVNYPLIMQFQAMRRIKESLICSILRKGALDIPLLFLMNHFFSLYGCLWVQPMVDGISLVAALVLYRIVQRKGE